MKPNPLFSILLANYNNGHFLESAVNSVLNQHYENWQLVIVDDRSTDSSRQYIDSLNDSRIKPYYNDLNEGVACTKNRCVEIADGELCGYLDPDDTLTPDALESVIDSFDSDHSLSMVYSDHYICDEHLLIIKEINNHHEPDSLMLGRHPNHFTAFKKSCYIQMGGIDLTLERAIDRDLVLRLEETGKVKHLSKILYNYRIHGGGISNTSNRLKAGYWTWVARFNACERRNISKEEVYVRVMQDRDERLTRMSKNHVYCTKDYRLGSSLLKPLRALKSYFV